MSTTPADIAADPEGYAEVMWLSGTSVKEVAQITGLSQRAVRRVLAAAQRRWAQERAARLRLVN